MSGTTERRRRFLPPEGVDLRVRLADGGERLGALLLDLGLMLVGLVAAVLLLGHLAAGLGLLAAFLVRNCYFLWFEMGPRAATPGKRALGLRVASRAGGRLSADAVLARNLMREIELFLPLTLLAAGHVLGGLATLFALLWSLCFALFALFNADRLRVGDLVAGTWVVAVPRPGLAPDLAARAAPAGPAFTQAQAEAYGEQELFVLEDVLRAGDPATLAEVARLIRARIGWAGATMPDAAFLNAYYAAARRRLEQRRLLGRRRRDKHDA